MTLVPPEIQPPHFSAADESPLRQRAQMAALADLAAEAVARQPEAQSAVSRCGALGVVPDAVALELGRLSHAYSLIYERARHLPVDAELLEARAELCRLLSYHLHMLRDAGDLAFSGRVDARTEPFRRELAHGLGPFATALVELAGRISAAGRRRCLSACSTACTAPDEFLLDDVDLDADEP